MKGKDWPQQGKPWRTLPGADISPTKLASKASRNLALEYRLRKPRTAARFGPKPCETATTKTLETSLTKPIKKKEKWKEKIGSSKENLGARFQEPTYRLQSLPQNRLEIWPWSTACESLEQQQDSGPSHAKPPPQKLSKRRLRNPLKRKMKGKDWLQQGTPLRKPWRTLPGADISPTKLASKASRNLALEYRLRKPRTAARFGPKPCETATTKTLETSLTKPMKKKEKWMKGKDWPQQGKPWRTLPGADISPTKLASKASRNLALEYRLRKPRTAARFGPKPCETATTKTLETSLTKPIKKKEKWKEKIGSSKENLCARC